MDKTEILKDGTKILIRNLEPHDINALMKFYRGLSDIDRRYLRVDVTNRKVIKERIQYIKSGFLFRLIALHEGNIIASSALEISKDEWRKHQAELRVIVARPFRHKGLGMIMMRELYFLAARKKIELLVVRMMRPQRAARRICRKLGFREELLIPDYLRDRKGVAQDMVVMVCDPQELWRELEHFYQDSDWQKYR